MEGVLKMDWNSLLFSLAALFGGYIFIFGLLKKINEWKCVRSLGEKKDQLPPGDMGWPYLGNTLTFLKAFIYGDPNSFIDNLISRFGQTGVYKTHLFVNPSIIVTLPETCRRVLTDDANFKFGYPASSKALAGRRSLPNLPYDVHKRMRGFASSPINGHEALSLCIDHIEQTTVCALEEWAGVEKIEFYTEMRKVVLKVITHIVFGNMTDESDLVKIGNLYEDLLNGLNSMPINLPGFAFHIALKSRKELVNVLQGLVDQRKKSTVANSAEGKKDLLGLLLGAKDEDGRSLDDEDIIDTLIIYLLAGHESSATATTWVAIYLDQHPQVFLKAKEEQEEILRRRPTTQKGLTLKEIKHMDYADKVIDEMLRHASMSFTLFRHAKNDVNINGYLIPKGWNVLVWTRAVHMDQNIYENPTKFNPDRWDGKKQKAGSFIPFGAGSWLCVGADLTKLEITIFLHYYLLNYKFERLKPNSPVSYLPVPMPKDKCLARVTKVQ